MNSEIMDSVKVAVNEMLRKKSHKMRLRVNMSKARYQAALNAIRKSTDFNKVIKLTFTANKQKSHIEATENQYKGFMEAMNMFAE